MQQYMMFEVREDLKADKEEKESQFTDKLIPKRNRVGEKEYLNCEE